MKHPNTILAARMALPLICLVLNSCDNSSRSDSPEATTYELRVETEGSTRKAWPPAGQAETNNLTSENYFVVFDDSGSMSGERIRQAKEALSTIAKNLPKEHNLGLIFLNKRSALALGTNNRDEFIQLIQNTQASGRTPLLKATDRAIGLITKQASSQKGLGAYHLIIVTDGESSDSSPLGLVRSAVLQTSIQVHVVGFHVGDHELNDNRYVDYQTASNTSELIKAFEAVAAETNTFTDPKDFIAQ